LIIQSIPVIKKSGKLEDGQNLVNKLVDPSYKYVLLDILSGR
jgi:hypothetical protein